MRGKEKEENKNKKQRSKCSIEKSRRKDFKTRREKIRKLSSSKEENMIYNFQNWKEDNDYCGDKRKGSKVSPSIKHRRQINDKDRV